MNRKTTRIVREEIGRTAAWLFFSVIGWSLIFNSMPNADVAATTLFGAVVATAVGMSLVVITVRLVTGRELKGGTESKDLLLLTTLFVVGFYLLWAYVTANWTEGTSALVVVCVGTVVVRIVRPYTFGIPPTEN